MTSIPDILVVEDEELNRDIMARHLEARNYTNIRFAVDGQDGLNKVAEKKPDLILLDIMLPEIMGLQVLHQLRQKYSMVDLPIIMVTAINEGQRIVRALELGANDYITKPINFPILMARIQTQLSLKQLSALNTEFLTTASHDLRKPLSIIQDIASNARHKIASGQIYDQQDLFKDLTRIGQSANYINNITECMLDMQASGFGQLRLTKAPLQIEGLINEVIERYRETANQKKISLISKMPTSKLVIEADRSRIAQVLDNFIGNGIRFCASGDWITITLKQLGDYINVEIQDTGMELSEQDLQQLFTKNTEPAAPVNSEDSNSRIGLPICKQLIELHDGSIGARNNSDKGATFWFSLPVFKLKAV